MLLHQVLGLENLHFGYWNPGDALTYNNCVAAQERYTDLVLGRIPQGARSVLDVGCGVGATSRELHERGYDVHSVTPDPYQVRVFRQHAPSAVRLHACPFQDVPDDVRTDVLLFGESSQYIPLDDWVRGCVRHLDADGSRSVIVADWFLRPGQSYYGTPHDGEVFLERLDREGFVLQDELDITREASPTLAYISKLHTEHLLPAFAFVDEFLDGWSPFWSRLSKRLARRRIESFKSYMRNDLRDRFDPEAFERRVRYRIFRFEVERRALP